VEQNRIETGAVQFGDDFPGTFIRGDNAMHYKMLLSTLVESLKSDDKYKGLISMGISSLLKDLECNAQNVDKGNLPCQFLKPYKECIKETTGEEK